MAPSVIANSRQLSFRIDSTAAGWQGDEDAIKGHDKTIVQSKMQCYFQLHMSWQAASSEAGGFEAYIPDQHNTVFSLLFP